MEVSPGSYEYFKLYLSEKTVDVEAALPAMLRDAVQLARCVGGAPHRVLL